MCTVSWSAKRGRLSLCFNRDERKDRAEALPPARLEGMGVCYLSALDPVGGGSWLCVNAFGLCVFLLNNYAGTRSAAVQPRRARSRGELPVHYVGMGTRAMARSTLRETDFAEYLPFYLGFADGEGVEVFGWDGRTLETVDASGGLLTTSSFRTDAVQAYRIARYEALLAADPLFGDATRRRFHTEIENPDAAFNPLMLREESKTHSVSTVEIDESGVTFSYEAVRGETRVLDEAVQVFLSREIVG